MSPAHHPPDPEKAALYSVSTSASPASKTDESTRPRQEVTQCKPSMARQCPLFVLILFAFLAITFVSACYGRGMVRGFHCEEGQRRFQELLDSVDATALHNVLHEHARDKYQHGIYQDDKTTMEAMHRENAEVATSLVELARRQAGNTTAVTATETSTELVTSTSLRDTSTTPPGTSSQNQVADPSTSRIQAITPTTSAAPTTQAPDLTTSASPTTPSTEAPTSAPTAAASPPSISAGQSTNGTFLGGPAAYPLAPPIPVPTASLASHVHNSSYVPPTAIPSFVSYVSFQNVSNPSSSAVSSSFTYAPPVLSSILVVQNKTTAPPATLHSAYLPPATPHFYNTSIPNVTSVYTSYFLSSSPLPPPMTFLSFAPVLNSPVVSTSPTPNYAAPTTSAVPYYSALNHTSILNSSSVSDNCTSTSSSNSSSPQTAMSSLSGSSFNNSTSGVSLSSSTPGGTVSPASTVSLAGTVSPGGSVSPASTVSPAGTATPSSDSPVSSAASAIPSTSGPGIFTSSTTVVQQSISVTVQSSTRSQASSNGATVDSSPSSTPATQGSTSGASTSDNPTSNSSKSTHSITQQTIYTTTFAGGKVATVTQVTVVAADETGSSGGSKTTTAQGSLQTNGARSGKQVGLNGILGALGLVVAGVL
ncbi:hypothetical protein BUE80_DR011028 [Diplocarpon rosae]|nr:hypothetical protein BUE80_DR011028 [Diplocarpon rosae]